MTENDIKEIARMWEYSHETTVDKAYKVLKYMGDTHNKNRQKSVLPFMHNSSKVVYGGTRNVHCKYETS